MSFKLLEAEIIVGVESINGQTYPPAAGTSTVTLNQVPVGTGNAPPSNVLSASHLKVTDGIGQTKLSTDNNTQLAIWNTMFPKDTGNAGDVLTCDGLGASTWEAPSGGTTVYPSTFLLPWTAFNYWNLYDDGSVNVWFHVGSMNSLTAVPVTNGQDLGSVSVPLQAGTWRFCLTLAAALGILNVTIDSVVTPIDSFLGSANYTYTWQQDIAASGNYTINYTQGGKNAGSASYDIRGRNTMGLMGVYLGITP